LWQSRDGLSIPSEFRADVDSSKPDTLPAPESPHGQESLSLRDVIDTALLQSPEAVTARAGISLNDATRVVTATYPWNPTVQVTVDPYTRDVAGNFLATKNSVSVTQTLELAHQPRYRHQAADATWNQQRAVIAQGELAAIISALRTYFDALYRRELSELASRNAQLQTKIASVQEHRFNAGLGTPTERLNASVAARQSQRLADLADIDYRTSLRALRVVLNLDPSASIDLTSQLTKYKWLPISNLAGRGIAASALSSNESPREEMAQAVSNRPDVIAARFAVDSAQANLKLAQANLTPNIATGPTYERDESGTLFFGLAAQAELTAWNTGHPLVRQRSAELQQQLIVLSQTQAKAAQQTQAAVRRYVVAYDLLAKYSAQKQSSDTEFQKASDSFEQGQASYLEVLTIQDNLNQEQKSYLDLLNEIAQAATDTVSALVVAPECLIETPGSPTVLPAK
jgi:outer membrane protein TolC